MEAPPGPSFASWHHLKLSRSHRRSLGSLFRLVTRSLNHMMIRRPAAGRIHGLEMTGQMERLTPASTKVDGTIDTGAARVGHPGLSSKAIEAFRAIPDVQ
jgi:hypothetical protein